MESVNRRQFVKRGTATVSALLGASCFFPGRAFARASQPIFEESSCNKPGKHILVAYESYCGTTSHVATRIADVLCKNNLKADVRKISSVTDMTIYDGAVIGSAVRSASWYPDAIGFVSDNKDRLSTIPVAYFLTCLALYYNTPEAKATADSYFNPVLEAVPEIRPLTRQAFAGVLDYDKLNMVVKMVMKSKMKKKGIPAGDFRDFDKIETWAQQQVMGMINSAGPS